MDVAIKHAGCNFCMKLSVWSPEGMSGEQLLSLSPICFSQLSILAFLPVGVSSLLAKPQGPPFHKGHGKIKQKHNKGQQMNKGRE